MTATASPEPTAVADDLAPMKWLIVIQGVAGIILGLLLLTAPGISSLVLVQFLALYWLVSGIIGLVSLIWDRTQWGWKVFGGVLGVVAGTAVLRHPMYATVLVGTTLVVFMGILALVFGVMNLVRAFSAGGGWGMGLLGALDVIIGLLPDRQPAGGRDRAADRAGRLHPGRRHRLDLHGLQDGLTLAEER